MPLPSVKVAFLLLVIGLPIFRAAGAPYKLTNLHSFDGPSGSTPYAGLIWGKDGNLYGTTYQGGTNGLPFGLGTVFRLTPEGGFTRLVSFNNVNGSKPRAALVQTEDGSFYGTTEFGGATGQGTLFRMTMNGELTTLLSFTNVNGARPVAKLLLASDGFLYGTTQYGGSDDFGTAFRADTNGQLVSLVSFAGAEGARPTAELIEGPDHLLYGTTILGGTFGWGTAFKMTANGALTTLVSFDAARGGNPFGGLTFGADGALYGTTSYGGIGFDGTSATGAGTVFRATTNGDFQVLHYFSSVDGSNPRSSLAPGPDGVLYGTTILGGGNDWGTVFQITTNGAFASLYSFDYDDNGTSPFCTILTGPYHSLYGTTSSQGPGLRGTAFRLDPAGATLQISLEPGTPPTISWSTLPGQIYQPQFLGDLSQTNWINFGLPLPATNGLLSFTDVTAPGTQRLYRVVLIVPP